MRVYGECGGVGMTSRAPKQPKTSRILERVRGLNDRELAELVAALRFITKLDQATLAKALQEQKRRKRQAREAATP